MTRASASSYIFLKLNHFISLYSTFELQKFSAESKLPVKLISPNYLIYPYTVHTIATREGQNGNKFSQYFPLELDTGNVPEDNVITSIY